MEHLYIFRKDSEYFVFDAIAALRLTQKYFKNYGQKLHGDIVWAVFQSIKREKISAGFRIISTYKSLDNARRFPNPKSKKDRDLFKSIDLVKDGV